MNNNNNDYELNNFESIQISLASPEKILEWSHGEVTKPVSYTHLDVYKRQGQVCNRAVVVDDHCDSVQSYHCRRESF